MVVVNSFGMRFNVFLISLSEIEGKPDSTGIHGIGDVGKALIERRTAPLYGDSIFFNVGPCSPSIDR